MEGINSAADIGSTQFLTLFIEQMKHQDPLEPIENSEFLSQLAQFSSLEQLGKQTDLLSDQVVNSSVTQALQELEIASSLIGKEVIYSNPDGSHSAGTVKGVKLKDEGIFFDIGIGEVAVADLLGIK